MHHSATATQDRGNEDQELSHYTQRNYVAAVAAFARHFGKSPEQLGREHVRKYLIHLRKTEQWFGPTSPRLAAAMASLQELCLLTPGTGARMEGILDTRIPERDRHAL